MNLEKALHQIEFSDMILSEENAFLTGCPGFGQKLMALPKESNRKLLLDFINQEFISKSSFNEDGLRELPASLRIEYANIKFRVADVKDVNKKQTWFLRRLPEKMQTLSEIGFPKNFTEWLLASEQNRGLVLMIGSQASGKTTLGSTLVVDRLKLHGGHAVTFEYPAELPIHGQHGEFGYCYQTEISGEKDLASHIERAYRYANPNIIYVGEIRTKYAATEVLRMGLSSSSQLIIATLHGKDITSALERLLNWASESEGINAYKNLADTLLAVFHTHLDITDTGKTLRIPEFLLCPFGVSEIHSIRSKIQDNKLESLKNDIFTQKNQLKFAKDNQIHFETSA